MKEYSNIKNALNSFKDKTILVIGDLILDKFMRGKVSRISPEAPVPVVDVTDEKYMPGGAGNVVSNILKLNSKVYMAGVVGNDFYGKELVGLLQGMGSEVSGVLVDESRPTSLKTRIIAEHQQVVRADIESKEEIPEKLVRELIGRIETVIEKADGVIISDYGKGLITTGLIEHVLKSVEGKNVPVIVDPQVGHFFEYRNVSSVTPNVKEASQALNIQINSEDTLNEAGRRLLEELNCETVLITRGEQGMALFMKDGTVKNIPTVAKEVYDVSGAGDTVASVYTLGLTAGLDYYNAAVLSNYAAAVVVGKLGTATASIEEIINEIEK